MSEIEQDNAAIRAVREQNSRLEADLKAARAEKEANDAKLAELQTKLTEIENAQMSEQDRIKNELKLTQEKNALLEQQAAEAVNYAQTIEKAVEARIEALPEAHRETVKNLLQHTPVASRLEQLEAITKLGNFEPVTQIGKPPSPTPNPGPNPVPSKTPEQGEVQFDVNKLPSWKEVLSKS